MVIVPIPCGSASVAFTAALKSSEKFSFPSIVRSPLMVTLKVVVPVAPPAAIEVEPTIAFR